VSPLYEEQGVLQIHRIHHDQPFDQFRCAFEAERPSHLHHKYLTTSQLAAIPFAIHGRVIVSAFGSSLLASAVESRSFMAAKTTDTKVVQNAIEGMHRFYGLAKHQAWDAVKHLSWGQIAPVPEVSGSPEKRARRQALWRSVVTQQLQADDLAVQVSVQLLAASPDAEARLYYSTMTQDEARHYEAWSRLIEAAGGACEPDPYLQQLGDMVMKVDSVEEKVWLLQVTFEGLVIPRFRQIAQSAPGTILAEICNKLTIDDGIHHGAGVCYERLLLARTTPRIKRHIEKVSAQMWPLYVQHIMWRPKERALVGSLMQDYDTHLVQSHKAAVLKLAGDFHLDLDLNY
jgi:hypothetical protein